MDLDSWIDPRCDCSKRLRFISGESESSARGRFGSRVGSGKAASQPAIRAAQGAISRALAKVPESSGGHVNLGVRADALGVRGFLDSAVRINRAVSFIAEGTIASPEDWSAVAGVRVQW